MDITKFKPVATSFLHLKSPVDEDPMFDVVADEKTAVGITFHSPGTPVYEAAQNRRTNRSLVRSKKNAEITADILRADAVTFLSDVTASFHGIDYPPAGDAKGEELFKAVYADREYAWVLTQANKHLEDWANFMKRSEAS